ncbi:MAG: SRPBCC family protein [Pseudomonadota bacterium]
MRRALHAVHIEAAPSRVWDLLIRFEAYPRWNRWIALSGEPRLGADLSYAANLGVIRGRERRLILRGKVSSLDPHRVLAWRAGVPGFRFEWFLTIAPQDGGTRLAHILDMHGLCAAPIGRRIEALWGRGAEGLLSDAKRRLEGGVRPRPVARPKPKLPPFVPPPPRKKGRRR